MHWMLDHLRHLKEKYRGNKFIISTTLNLTF